MAKRDILILFDIDGTLSPSRLTASDETKATLRELKKRYYIGVVGGSEFDKQKEQLGNDVLEQVDYSFSENGLVAYKEGKLFHKMSIKDYLGEDKIKELVNFLLHYLADLDIPKKRGTFIEFRTGMINVCPIGRNCNQEERIEFFEYDKQHGIRKKLVEVLKAKFAHLNLAYSIGGQISIDVFPKGWDKTYCLQHVEEMNFKEIHFFGDMVQEGGNDFEIYSHPKVVGHQVTSPEDTVRQLKELFFKA
eukprot:TRINITY_DN13617_c0_g1_i1.p1 TRINITY_DN13617_c0_g1~~TRINITY_DN13617_c0_g1_i1.p1  ORF type:complete len:268 (+),score=57.23 TRINITY_DN13617_c0_g1_i1:61-804(+)